MVMKVISTENEAALINGDKIISTDNEGNISKCWWNNIHWQ